MKHYPTTLLTMYRLFTISRHAEQVSKRREFANYRFSRESRLIKSIPMSIFLLVFSFLAVLNDTHAYVSTDADRSACILDDKKGRTAPDFTIRGFAPYKDYLEGNASVNVDVIMDRLGQLINDKAKINSIEIVGHAAKYGSSNFLQTSQDRALVVEAEIKSSLIAQVPQFNEDLVPFNTYGVSIYCPVDANNTQANRAKNRRVEVWIDYSLAVKTKKPSLKRLLKYAERNSDVKATSCMARKLRKDGYDHNYISRNTIEEALKEKLSGDVLINFLNYKIDLRAHAKAQRKKIIDTPRESKSSQERFLKFLERSRRDLVKAITIDLTLKECNDPRIHAMRKHVRKQLSKRNKSFYSCPTIKGHIEKMYSDNNNSYRGCGKGY